MQNDVKQNLQSEALINCLDVLCRANATVFESDPKLAADITQAIEALSTALQSEDFPAPGPTYIAQTRRKSVELFDYSKKILFPIIPRLPRQSSMYSPTKS